MNVKEILGNTEYEAFLQLIKDFIPSSNRLGECEQNPYLALEFCDEALKAIDDIVANIKEDLKNKISISLSRITRLRDKKKNILFYKEDILKAIKDEENQIFAIIEEIEKMHIEGH